jgi:hypothetical protein
VIIGERSLVAAEERPPLCPFLRQGTRDDQEKRGAKRGLDGGGGRALGSVSRVG